LIGPGASNQPLHRDDMLHHRYSLRKEPPDYEIGQDSAIGFFISGKKTTKANGATRFIPGSHLWGHMTLCVEELTYSAELELGDGFIVLASCYHCGSANTTEDQEKLAYSCFMAKGYLRQVRGCVASRLSIY
jgi:ectoine hydroxylase-related dioxygenase (phytanoyl-CoA dioxygenase family)